MCYTLTFLGFHPGHRNTWRPQPIYAVSGCGQRVYNLQEQLDYNNTLNPTSKLLTLCSKHSVNSSSADRPLIRITYTSNM